MNRRRSILSLLLLLLNGIPCHASGIAESTPGWILRQRSQFVGEVDVHLTSTSMKVFDSKTSTILLSTAPLWDVCIYNTNAKTKFTSRFSEFKGYRPLGFAIMMGLYISGISLEKKSMKTVFKDVQASVYDTPEAYSKNSRKVFEAAPEGNQKFFDPSKKDHGSIRNLRVLTTTNWPLSKQESIILARYYGLADVNDIPLNANSINQDGEKKEVLTTLTIKKVLIPKSEFSVPNDCHTVGTLEQVRLDHRGQDGMEGLIDGLDQHLNK